jgi:hypothetical protein
MVGSLRLGHLEAEDGTKHIQVWRVGSAFSPGTTRVAVGDRCGGSVPRESQLLHSAKPWGRAEEGLGVLGYARGRLAKFFEWRISELQRMTCPNPHWYFWGSGKSSAFRPLTGLTRLVAEQVSKSRK